MNGSYTEKYLLSLTTKKMQSNINDIEEKILLLDSQINSKTFSNTNIIREFKDKVTKKTIRIDSTGYKNFAKVLSQRTSLINQINQKTDSLFVTKKQLQSIYASEGSIIAVCNNGIQAGLIICFLGFIFWYRNHQVYQDLILKIQSGYKIIPKKTNKPSHESKSEDILYLEAWKSEVDKSRILFLITIIVLLVIFGYIYNWKYPAGFYKSQQIDLVVIEKG